jgi:hypothetical protein
MANGRNPFRSNVHASNITFPGQFENQGGGNKKAGLPGTTNRPYSFPIALKVHPTRNTLFDYGDPIVFGLRHTRNKCVSISKPISSTVRNTYFSIPGRGTRGISGKCN